MRTMIPSVILVFTVMTASGVAQEHEKAEGKSAGGKGALIGAFVGGGAALIYGLTSDFCRNPVGEYNESDQAKLCAAPIAGMIGAGTLVGYLIGRHDKPSQEARAQRSRPVSGAVAVDILTVVPAVHLKPAQAEGALGDRFFRNLFTQPEDLSSADPFAFLAPDIVVSTSDRRRLDRDEVHTR